jgi:hypothetical protein
VLVWPVLVSKTTMLALPTSQPMKPVGAGKARVMGGILWELMIVCGRSQEEALSTHQALQRARPVDHDDGGREPHCETV